MHITREFYAPLLLPRTEWRRIPLETTHDLQFMFENSVWRQRDNWDGFLHPHTGTLGKLGGGYVWGYMAYFTGMIPGWMYGIAATLAVRRFL